MVSDQAEAAIAGLTNSELASKITALEGLRAETKKWSWSNPFPWFSGKEARILQAEVAELALAYQTLENRRAADAINLDHYFENIRLIGGSPDAGKLQYMLRHWYRSELEHWERDGLNLLTICQRVIEREKGPIPQ